MIRMQPSRGLVSLFWKANSAASSAASLVSKRNLAAIVTKQKQAGSLRVLSQASQFQSPSYASDGYGGANVDLGQSQNPNEQGFDLESTNQSPQYPPGDGAPGAYVPAPPSCVWQPELVNDVRLIGRVGTVPQFRLMRSGKAVATTRIAVRGRGPEETNWIDVEFWDVHAYQVVHYVAKGVQIAIGGRLKRDIWTKRDGSTDSTVKVVASYLHIVTPSPPATDATPWDGTTFPSAAPGEEQQLQQDLGPQATPAATPPATRAPRGALPKDQRLFARWRGDPSVTWGSLVSEQGGNPQSMLNSLVDGCVGAPDVTPAELSRMASELQMGPMGDVFVVASEVGAAIDDVLAAQPGTSLDTLRLKPVRDRLLQGGGHQLMGQKIQRQEQGSGPMTSSITYGQIRLVKCCKQKGIPLESLVTQNPRPIPELLGAGPIPV